MNTEQVWNAVIPLYKMAGIAFEKKVEFDQEARKKIFGEKVYELWIDMVFLHTHNRNEFTRKDWNKVHRFVDEFMQYVAFDKPFALVNRSGETVLEGNEHNLTSVLNAICEVYPKYAMRMI